MNGPPTEIEISTTRRVDAIGRRPAPASSRAGAPSATCAAPASVPPLEFPGPPADLSTGLLAALGRVLLGIAGAYLLRAITEAALLPQLAGSLVGLLYAGAWLASAAGIRPANRLMATFHALTAALIAGPLLWESTVRFHSLSPKGAAAAIALFIVLGQVAAWRRDLSVIAGVASLAGSATALVLIIATLNPVPFTIALLVAVAAIEYGACRDRALSLRWIIALAVDFCAFLLLYLVTRPQGVPEGYAPIPIPTVITIQIALVVIYVVSTVIRTLRRKLPIAGFEIAQLAITISLVIGCGFQLAHGAGIFAIGAACLAAGVFSYFVAFASRSIPRRNFHAYATFAGLLVSIGSVLALTPLTEQSFGPSWRWPPPQFGEQTRRNTLRIHGALYLVAASFSSGLLAYSTERMISISTGAWSPLRAASMLCATNHCRRMRPSLMLAQSSGALERARIGRDSGRASLLEHGRPGRRFAHRCPLRCLDRERAPHGLDRCRRSNLRLVRSAPQSTRADLDSLSVDESLERSSCSPKIFAKAAPRRCSCLCCSTVASCWPFRACCARQHRRL